MAFETKCEGREEGCHSTEIEHSVTGKGGLKILSDQKADWGVWIEVMWGNLTGRGYQKGNLGPSLLCWGCYFVVECSASVLAVNDMTCGGKNMGRSRETGVMLSLILPRKKM